MSPRLLPDAPLARVLGRGRERYNAAVEAAARQGKAVDPEALAEHLVTAVAPAVAAVEPAAAEPVTDALFALSLDLLGRGVLGRASSPAVAAAWKGLLPALPGQLAEAPRPLAVAISNAAFNLARTPGARPDEWLGGMAGLGPLCASARELLEAGQVLAWRAGMAHYRRSALAAWERLPDRLAGPVLGLSGRDAELPRERLRERLADPWRRADAAPEPVAGLRLVGRVGGFRGFGGTFLTPPRLEAGGGAVWASDAEGAFLLHADAYGQTLTRAAAAPSGEPGPEAGKEGRAAAVAADGTLTFAGLTARFPLLAGGRARAAGDHVLAVVPPRSHWIRLVARCGGQG